MRDWYNSGRKLNEARMKNEVLEARVSDLLSKNSRLMNENRKLAKEITLLNMEISLLKEKKDGKMDTPPA